MNSLTWEIDTFAYADSYDDAAARYRGLRSATLVTINAHDSALIVKPEVAKRQLDAEAAARRQREDVAAQQRGEAEDATMGDRAAGVGGSADSGLNTSTKVGGGNEPSGGRPRTLRRFHGSVALSAERAGRDASKIAEEVIAHLTGLLGANVRVTLEIDADIPNGAPEHVVRTVTENSRTLKFTQAGFEEE